MRLFLGIVAALLLVIGPGFVWWLEDRRNEREREEFERQRAEFEREYRAAVERARAAARAASQGHHPGD